MSRNYRAPVVNFATGINAAEATPSSASDGLAIPDDANPSEVVWFLSGGTSGTIQFWYYDDVAAAWCEGGTASFTGNSTVKQFLYGKRVAIQFTAIVGTYRKSYQLVSSGG